MLIMLKGSSLDVNSSCLTWVFEFSWCIALLHPTLYIDNHLDILVYPVLPSFSPLVKCFTFPKYILKYLDVSSLLNFSWPVTLEHQNEPQFYSLFFDLSCAVADVSFIIQIWCSVSFPWSGAQALMSGSSPVLGCNSGAVSPAGVTLSGLLPSGSLLPNTLPSAVEAASPAGQNSTNNNL